MTLIDKAALLNRIATEVHYDSERSLEMYAKLLNEINDAPTVDAVPLEDYKSMEQTVNKLTEAIANAEPVRCRDCKYYIADGCDECQLMSAKSIIASINDKRWYSDFYCAWGERREDD